MKTSLFVLSALMLSAIQSCGGCGKKPPPPASRAKSLPVDLSGKAYPNGEFEVVQYRVGTEAIAASDGEALRAAIGRKKAAAGDRPLVIRILAPRIATYGQILPILTAAAAAGVSDLTLACPSGDPSKPITQRPKGEPLGVGASAGSAGLPEAPQDTLEIRVRRGAGGKGALYEIGQADAVATSAEELDKLLAARKAGGSPAAACVRPTKDARAAAVVAALAGIRRAGFERAYAGQPVPVVAVTTKAAEPPRGPRPLPPGYDPSAPKPPSSFGGTGGRAYHVVYLIDRSGSMSPSFDQIQREMVKSIAALDARQDFHVVMFGGNRPIESPQRTLMDANSANKLEATSFVNGLASSGITQPITALRRAFQVFKEADARPGKLIYMLTDGDFSDPDFGITNEQVVEAIKTHNRKKDVVINTILFGRPSAKGEKVLKQIAAENGGKYKHVEPQ